MTVRQALRRLRTDGWFVDRTRGSHRQLKHPTKPGVVTVAGHPKADVPPRTLKSIFKQAALNDAATPNDPWNFPR